jgi:hypothetical protein
MTDDNIVITSKCCGSRFTDFSENGLIFDSICICGKTIIRTYKSVLVEDGYEWNSESQSWEKSRWFE